MNLAMTAGKRRKKRTRAAVIGGFAAVGSTAGDSRSCCSLSAVRASLWGDLLLLESFSLELRSCSRVQFCHFSECVCACLVWARLQTCYLCTSHHSLALSLVAFAASCHAPKSFF